jgi:hydrogenase nickel incorporation protein HypA/HybF
MHELSIIEGVVSTVTEAMAAHPGVRICSVRLKVGALSGVAEDALQFGYEIATAGTILAGSRLEVIHQPVKIFCTPCGEMRELEGVQSFRCPVCGTPSCDIRQGRELEVESVEIEEAA